jgi:hypothetical protein
MAAQTAIPGAPPEAACGSGLLTRWFGKTRRTAPGMRRDGESCLRRRHSSWGRFLAPAGGIGQSAVEWDKSASRWVSRASSHAGQTRKRLAQVQETCPVRPVSGGRSSQRRDMPACSRRCGTRAHPRSAGCRYSPIWPPCLRHPPRASVSRSTGLPCRRQLLQSPGGIAIEDHLLSGPLRQ